MNSALIFYINQLSPKRAEIYSKSWWIIGNAIYRLFKGSKVGYDFWHKFSEQDIKKYDKNVCDKKWESFKKGDYFISINTIIQYVYEDGGSTYNPNHKNMIENEEVKNFVYDVLLPKLSIRRMRNMKALTNLCSALFNMSLGKDRDVLDDVCKRIKDEELKNRFVFCWEKKYFRFQYGLNDIIVWLNHDEKEKFLKQIEKANPKPYSKISQYFPDDLEWVEKTKRQLKRIDDRGYKPFYLKGHLGNREKKLHKM